MVDITETLVGQFDQQIDPEQGVSLTPDPSLDPLSPGALGVPAALLGSAVPASAPMPPPVPLPTPPQAPGPPGNLQHILSMALLGLAAGLGPRHGGTGVAHGLMMGQDANQQQRQQTFKDQQQQYQQQVQLALHQQQLQEVAQKAEQARQDKLRQNLMMIGTQLKTVRKKDEYDQQIGSYANLLGMDPNKLRTMVPPFVAPKSNLLARDAITDLFKSPLYQQQLKENPQAVAAGSMMIDLNGDGIKEKRTVQEVMDAAGMSLLLDEKGQPVAFAPSATGPMANIALKNQIAQFQSENRRPPKEGAEMNALIDKAKNVGKDPEMADLAKQSKETQLALQKMQLSQQPTREDALPIAQDLVKHNMAPSQLQLFGGFGASGQAFKRMVLLEAKKLDPNFNFEEAESTYQLVKSPAFQQTVRYMDTVVKSAPRVLAAAQRLGNGQLRSVNALINAGKNQFNNVDLKKFKTDVTLVADEIAKVLQGGGTGSGTSDAKLRQASEILNASDSPAAIAGALSEVSALIANRRTELTRGTYMDTGGGSDPAASAREKLNQR